MYLSKSTIGIAISILILYLILTFNPHPRVSLVEDGSAYLINSSWWGLRTEEHEIRLYGYGWQAKSANGEWYPISFD